MQIIFSLKSDRPLRPIFFMAERTYRQYEQGRLLEMRRSIAEYIGRSTKVIDHASGYVVCEGLNHAVDPTLLSEAAQVITGTFLAPLPAELQPTMVIGVPNRGRELAVAIGLEVGLTIGVTERMEMNGDGDKEFQAVYDGRNDMVTIAGIRSFTKPGKVFSHTIRGVRPGSTILVADDFSAYGHATDQYIRGLNELGISAVFAYLAAKDFPFLDPAQIGYRRHKEKGDNVFAVVRLTNIIGGNGGKVIATSEDI